MKNNKKQFTLEQIQEMYYGKSGPVDSETIINDSKFDKDLVSVWSDNKDISHIIKRCKNSIVDWKVTPLGVELLINKKTFRGAQYCFKYDHDE